MIKKSWNTEEWKNKREEWIKDKVCEWCSSTDKLTIHHTKELLPYFDRWRIVSSKLLNESLKNGEFKYTVHEDSVNRCPKCNYSVKERITIKPRYRCYRCQIEFDEPVHYVISNRLSKEDYNKFNENYKPKIKEVLNKEYEEYNNYYLTFKDCIVLCNKCHFAYHKGMHLCPKCRIRYARNRFETCFNCSPNTDRKKEIKEGNEIMDITLPCGYMTKLKRVVYENEIPCGEINCPKDIYYGDCEDFLKDNYGPNFDFKKHMIEREIRTKKYKERKEKKFIKRRPS